MKILLMAINAKYIHSNPAVYSLYAYAGKEVQEYIEIAEYTVNQRIGDILADIYERQPNVIAVSCYLWNISIVEILVRELVKVLPGVPVWLGGPEVSYGALQVLERLPDITGVMIGEGEQTFRDLCMFYTSGNNRITGICGSTETVETDRRKGLSEIPGIAFHDGSGEAVQTPPRALTDLNDIPFLYGDHNFPLFTNRIVYYESSRGCPFSCSYCLSSIDKSVRFRDGGLVEEELRFFLDRCVPQVKFIDRTFNCSHAHAMRIWKFIKENDNGVTNFHFEIAADILNEEELELLNSFRPGLVQLEIGVQSTNPATVKEIRRTMDFEKLSEIVRRIQAGRNIHEHLDLIAGLPFEDYQTFVKSFNDVMSLKPEQLQLGFLKVLKGSPMYENAKEYGLAYTDEPPYEVLFTKWISYEEIRRLKAVEEMVELYYNSCQFRHTLALLKRRFPDYYSMYECLADFYKRKGYGTMNPSRLRRYEILLEFAEETGCGNVTLASVREALTLDLYLRENLKSRPDFCADLGKYKDVFRRWYRGEAEKGEMLPDYSGYDARQLAKMTHMDVIGGKILLFDYKNRDPLTKDAQVLEIEGVYGEKK